MNLSQTVDATLTSCLGFLWRPQKRKLEPEPPEDDADDDDDGDNDDDVADDEEH